MIYINDTALPKAVRWKLAIKEYDFGIGQIAGKNNTVTDGLSRFSPFPTQKEEGKDSSIDVTEYVMGIIDIFVIPHDLYEDKDITRCHNSIVRLRGMQITFTKVGEYLIITKNEELFAYMREYIRMFIKQCPCRQKMSRLKVPIHTHPFTTT